MEFHVICGSTAKNKTFENLLYYSRMKNYCLEIDKRNLLKTCSARDIFERRIQLIKQKMLQINNHLKAFEMCICLGVKIRKSCCSVVCY